MKLQCLVCFFLTFCASCFPWAEAKPESERLLLVMVDGFRYDYLNQSGLPLPGFEKLMKLGVKADGFVPDFPSVSYPNYYSIMTGLHTESHGMTSNNMYDVRRKEYFLLEGNPEQKHQHWWNHAEPLWITAVRQNLRSHMYHWRECDVEIGGLLPTFCRPYAGIPALAEFQTAIDHSLQVLRSGQTDMAGIYYEQIDNLGHLSGPFSDEVNQAIRDLDPIISDLVDRLGDPELADVNLLIFSDHGMAEVNQDRLIELWRVLDTMDDVIVLDQGPVVSIFPDQGMEQQVFDKLKNFHPHLTVYRQSDLPDRWHYKHGPYVAPLTAVADLGWYILTPGHRAMGYKGYHGYDPVHSEMQGIFLALGPAFTPGARVERLRNVDIYQLMCNILNIQAQPNNGTIADVTPLLTLASSMTFSAICILSLLSIIVFLMR